MSKTIKYLTTVAFCLFFTVQGSIAQRSFGNKEYGIDQGHFDTFNQDEQKVTVTDDIVSTNDAVISDSAIRQGAYTIVNENLIDGDNKVDEIKEFYGENDQNSTAFNQTAQLVKNIINYILGALGFISLIYFMYYGYRFVVGADEDSIKEAGKRIKTSAIAIGGIGLAWIVVSFMFYIVGVTDKPLEDNFANSPVNTLKAVTIE